MANFLAELRRRNVDRAAAFYAAAAWLAVQIATQVFPFFDLPNWSVRLVIIAVLVGFPVLLLFSWFYEITPEGLKLERDVERHESITHHTGKKIDRLIIATLALAVVLLLADRFVLHKDANGAPALSDQSIAVLPFVDMSADKDQEYMSDGLAEELLNLLAKIPALHVTSRTSAFSFKGKEVGIADIARQLNVAHILEGSVRKAGNKLRITAQLIDTRSDTHLWSETYDRTLDDILAVQDEIAAAIVAQLRITLDAAPKTRKADPKAYALFLQARETALRGTAGDHEHAIALYQQGLDIDPNYAPGWAGIANEFLVQGNKGLKPIDESYRLARGALDKALAVDPDLVQAHTLASRIASDYDNDMPAAIRHIERAMALEPTNVSAIAAASDLADSLGRIDLAMHLNEYAVARDPVSPSRHGAVAFEYARSGRLDDAIASYRTALRLAPNRLGTHYNIAEILLRQGKASDALDELQHEPEENWRLMGQAMALHALGRKTESDAALAALIAKFAEDSSYNIAYVLAWRGETDRAFEWLDKAIEYHDTGLVEIPTDPMFASLHDDARWLPFLRKIGKAPEQLAVITFDVALPKDAR
jgi:TolB-like protein